MAFAEVLRKLLNEKGMRAADLARKSGLSEAIISEYLNGKKEPRGKQSALIADALQISLDDLWETEYSKSKDNSETSSNTIYDRDIKRIARARQQMSPERQEAMMHILEAAFTEYFSDEFEDPDTHE